MSWISRVGRRVIIILLFVVVAVAVLSSLLFAISTFILPDAREYDDPNTTQVQESFPWNPNLFSSFSNACRVGGLLVMGILRHIATLPQHIHSSTLIYMVGYVFVTMFLYQIRRTFKDLLEKKEMELEKYVKWVFGSIVGAIIYLAGVAGERENILAMTIAILLLSISALFLYIIHPESGLLSTIKNRVYPRIPCPSCEKEIPPDSKFCPNCGKELKDKDKSS